MKDNKDKISLHRLYSRSTWLYIPLGEGEWMEYPDVIGQDILDCIEKRNELQKLRFPTDEQKKNLEELLERIPMLEDEYMKVTRFQKGELLDALLRTTHKKWQFSHSQTYDKMEKVWKLSLQIRDVKGTEGCVYSTFKLKDKISDFSDIEEVKAKISNFENGSGFEKMKRDDALKYFMTGDPQFSYKLVSNFSWQPAKVALRQHLCSHFVDMDIYNSYGPSRFLVKRRIPESEEGKGTER